MTSRASLRLAVAAATLGAALIGAATTNAWAQDGGRINTGGENGAYFGKFCPLLKNALATSRLKYNCAISAGSRENMQRIIGNPADVGFAQFDVFALEKTMLGKELFTELRSDGARECLFMVTRNPELANFGDVTGQASELRFVLPPEKSGSASTFEFLRHIDPDGLGLAREITHAASTDEAIEKALSAEDTVTLFVQYPDPSNKRFKAVSDKGGRFIPVIDRNVLRQQIEGKKLYFAQETELANIKWTKTADSFVTACTPMVVFTGNSGRIDGTTERKDHEDLVRTVRNMDIAKLQPNTGGGILSRLWRKSKALSARSLEKMLELSDRAREKAGPMMKRAKELGKDALDKAGEFAEDARDKTRDLIDDTRDALDDDNL